MSDMADVLGDLWDNANATGLDGWIGPGRGAGEVDDYAIQTRERDIAKAAAALSAAGFGPVKEAKAEAWDEGKNAVWTFMSNQDPRRERPANPYRAIS